MPGRIARKAFFVCLPLRAGASVGIAALGLILGTNTLQTVVANGDTRSITFQHTHRDDSITVTFKRNGRYDEDGLKKLNYFLRDWRNDEQTRMDPQLFDILWEVTREVGTSEPIRIVSSYRSPVTNAMLRRRSRGVAKFSQHTLGKAIDFNISGVSVEQLRVVAMRLQRGGVGFYPGSFVHVDVGSVRHWPRMTHDQLARVFPNGRTVHVPSDGQPLPGYAQALADIERRGTSGPSGMSLAAARSSGSISENRVASVSNGSSKRSALAKLFGFGKDEDDEEEASAPVRGGRTQAVAARATEEPASVSAARAVIPLPQARPAALAAKPATGGGFALASASTVPFELGSSRPARPPAAVPEAESTSSITAWLRDTEMNGRTDRVSPDVALAYAATATQDPRAVTPAPAVQAARAMPAAATTLIQKTPQQTANLRIPPKPGQIYNDPWMRGITLATSVHYAMNVTVYGALDVRQIRTMMLKPGSSVPMTFRADPYDGLQTQQFTGAAVAFLPTVTFGFQRQASLR